MKYLRTFEESKRPEELAKRPFDSLAVKVYHWILEEIEKSDIKKYFDMEREYSDLEQLEDCWHDPIRDFGSIYISFEMYRIANDDNLYFKDKLERFGEVEKFFADLGLKTYFDNGDQVGFYVEENYSSIPSEVKSEYESNKFGLL